MVGGECVLILQLNLSVNQSINSLFEKKNAHTNCITATLSSESAIIYHEST